jgi:hypothetical protein
MAERIVRMPSHRWQHHSFCGISIKFSSLTRKLDGYSATRDDRKLRNEDLNSEVTGCNRPEGLLRKVRRRERRSTVPVLQLTLLGRFNEGGCVVWDLQHVCRKLECSIMSGKLSGKGPDGIATRGDI